jgi:hypothetical protein
VLDGHQNRPSPLPADAYALQEPQDDEQYRRQEAYRFEGRQQPDQERRDAHDE